MPASLSQGTHWVPKIGNQLIHWFAPLKRQHSCPCTITCVIKCSFWISQKGASLENNEVAHNARNNCEDFFLMPKNQQQKYTEMNNTLPDDHVQLVCFFEQCQHADHSSGILDQLQKEKKVKVSKKSSTKTNASSDCDCRHKPCQCDGHCTCLHNCNDRHNHHCHYN